MHYHLSKDKLEKAQCNLAKENQVNFVIVLNTFKGNVVLVIYNRRIVQRLRKKIMSVTISNCDQICSSPTNTSPSKMLYSFPKTTRFNSRKIILCDRFYDLPSSVNSCRTTTLGIGHKYDFAQDASTNPPPNTYSIKGIFTPNLSQGFGFGKGRQEMQTTGPLACVKTNKNPGPGAYQLGSTLSKSAYSLTAKHQQEHKQKTEVPGPGSYPVTFGINQKGNYFLSKYKNSCVRNFSKIGGRSQTNINKIPGPGSYDTSHVDLSPQGRYVSSKMGNCLSRKFGVTTRKPIAENNENPGPGNYKLPSQFGHYLSKKIFQQQSQNRKPLKAGKTEQAEN